MFRFTYSETYLSCTQRLASKAIPAPLDLDTPPCFILLGIAEFHTLGTHESKCAAAIPLTTRRTPLEVKLVWSGKKLLGLRDLAILHSAVRLTWCHAGNSATRFFGCRYFQQPCFVRALSGICQLDRTPTSALLFHLTKFGLFSLSNNRTLLSPIISVYTTPPSPFFQDLFASPCAWSASCYR